MSEHLRTRIRARLMQVCTGLPTTGTRVFASRVTPLSDWELPALRIYTGAEGIGLETISAPALTAHTLEIEIQACVKAIDGYEETADRILLEVERALGADFTLGGLVKHVLPREVSVERDGEGEQTVHVATLRCEAVYYAALGAPDIAY